jgi:non-homologous end joining protein Ku
MAMFRKGLVLSFGMLTAIVGLEGTIEKETGLKTVCCGPDFDSHAPTPVNQQLVCKTCAGVVKSTDLKKAKLIGTDQYQVVTAEEVAAAKTEAAGNTKKELVLTNCASEDVDCQVLATGSSYYVVPDGVGQTAPYAAFLDWVTRHPERSLLFQFTPTSVTSPYRLKAFNGVLVIEQLCSPESLKAVPNTGTSEISTKHQTQLDMIFESDTVDFDPALYSNVHAKAMAELLASKSLVLGVAPEKASKSTTPATTPVLDLSATLDAMTAVAKTKTTTPVRKTTRRRKTA